MKLSMMIRAADPIEQDLCAQLGVKYAITKAAPELTGMNAPWDLEALRTVQERFTSRGITLYGLEGDEFDMTRIKLGLPGRDEDLQKYCRMLENMGKLGIKLLCYNFMGGVGWYRSNTHLLERGGAITCGFDAKETPVVELKITREQMWENYEYFLKAVLPTAEKAGVKLGLHPDDPPIPNLLGYSRILISADDYRRAMALSDSPSHGITFCQATFQMMGEDVYALMEEWGERIFFLHFRDAAGKADCFRETFHDNGPTDMVKLMQAADKWCPDCIVRPDHTPAMAGEGEADGYTVKGNLFAVGYIRGICQGANIQLD